MEVYLIIDRTLRLLVILVMFVVVLPAANANEIERANGDDQTTRPPRRAPHDTAKALADQLERSAARVVMSLGKLPPGRTDSEKSVRASAKAFADEANALRIHMTRFLVDRRPVDKSLKQLNGIAWGMKKALDGASKYRTVWSDWARTVGLLRKVQRAVPRR